MVLRRLKILFLCDTDSESLQNAILEHIWAIQSLSQHSITSVNPRDADAASKVDLSQFDLILIHFGICIILPNYLPPNLAQKISSYRGPKVQFIQDEYRWTNVMVDQIHRLGIHTVFTLARGRAVKGLYGDPKLCNVEFVTTHAGLVSERLAQFKALPIAERSIDLGYRARQTPYWWGALGNEKVRIAGDVMARIPSGITLDISARTEDRILGDAWYHFVGRCRAMLGVESGSSIADFDGQAERRVKSYCDHHPGSDFPMVAKAVLRPFEGNVDYRVISPRVFEAAALRTAMVMFPGEHSGLVEPWRNYIPLERDFSNLDRVVGCLRDHGFLQEMVDCTYQDLIVEGQFSYRNVVAEMDEILDRVARRVADEGAPSASLLMGLRSRYRRAAYSLGIHLWFLIRGDVSYIRRRIMRVLMMLFAQSTIPIIMAYCKVIGFSRRWEGLRVMLAEAIPSSPSAVTDVARLVAFTWVAKMGAHFKMPSWREEHGTLLLDFTGDELCCSEISQPLHEVVCILPNWMVKPDAYNRYRMGWLSEIVAQSPHAAQTLIQSIRRGL